MDESTKRVLKRIIRSIMELEKAATGWGAGGVKKAVENLRRVAREEIGDIKVEDLPPEPEEDDEEGGGSEDE